MFCIIFLLFEVSVCNWSQFGHDERNTFQSDYVSKSSEEWSVQLDAYAPVPHSETGYTPRYPMTIDDERGIIWIFSDQGYYLDVSAIDIESGKVKFSTSTECGTNSYKEVIDCGYPIITEDGNFVFISGEKSAIYSINLDGKYEWVYNISRDPRNGYDICDYYNLVISDNTEQLSKNTIVFQNADCLTQENREIYGVKDDSPKEIWKMDNSTYTKSRVMSRFTVMDDYVFFFDLSDLKPTNLWIIQASTGQTIAKKQQVFTNEEFEQKIAIDKTQQSIYFIEFDPDFAPKVVCFEYSVHWTLHMKWNVTIAKPFSSCKVPLVTGDGKVVVLCQDNGHYLSVLDGESGEFVLKSINLEGTEGTEVNNLVLIDRFTVLVQGVEGPILSVDLRNGELKTLMGFNDDLFNYLTSDSSGCFYYVTGKAGKKPITLNRKCK